MDWLAEQYGNLASVLGLLVSAATLAVAALTKARLDQAKQEVLGKVDKMETLWFVSNAETAVAELLAYCDATNWAFAVDRCSTVLRLLHALKRSACLPPAPVLTIRRGIDDLNEIRDVLVIKHQRHDTHRLDKRKWRVIGDLAVAIADIRATLSRLIREE